MTTANIWVIDHKASLDKYSPMNMDDSSWLLGVCVLAAPDQDSAQSKFAQFLASETMTLLELYEFSAYLPTDYADGSERSKQINHAVALIEDDGETCYVYAQTSAALALIQARNDPTDT